MKRGTHPNYEEAKVTCSCGETFTTRSTTSELKVELCSKCHPFYTGKQKLVDSGGRVQRFQKKYGLGVTKSNSESEESAEDKKETVEEVVK